MRVPIGAAYQPPEIPQTFVPPPALPATARLWLWWLRLGTVAFLSALLFPRVQDFESLLMMLFLLTLCAVILWGLRNFPPDALTLGLIFALGSLCSAVLTWCAALDSLDASYTLDYHTPALEWLLVLLQGIYAGSALRVFWMTRRAQGGSFKFLGACGTVVTFAAVLGLMIGPWHRIPTEVDAVGALRIISTAESSYATAYAGTFSPSLAALGPPKSKETRSESAAGLIDSALAAGIKYGYRFEYKPTRRRGKKVFTSYTVCARPLPSTRLRDGSRRSFSLDPSDALRYVDADRCPTSHDAKL